MLGHGFARSAFVRVCICAGRFFALGISQAAGVRFLPLKGRAAVAPCGVTGPILNERVLGPRQVSAKREHDILRPRWRSAPDGGCGVGALLADPCRVVAGLGRRGVVSWIVPPGRGCRPVWVQGRMEALQRSLRHLCARVCTCARFGPRRVAGLRDAERRGKSCVAESLQLAMHPWLEKATLKAGVMHGASLGPPLGDGFALVSL